MCVITANENCIIDLLQRFNILLIAIARDFLVSGDFTYLWFELLTPSHQLIEIQFYELFSNFDCKH